MLPVTTQTSSWKTQVIRIVPTKAREHFLPEGHSRTGLGLGSHIEPELHTQTQNQHAFAHRSLSSPAAITFHILLHSGGTMESQFLTTRKVTIKETK